MIRYNFTTCTFYWTHKIILNILWIFIFNFCNTCCSELLEFSYANCIEAFDSLIFSISLVVELIKFTKTYYFKESNRIIITFFEEFSLMYRVFHFNWSSFILLVRQLIWHSCTMVCLFHLLKGLIYETWKMMMINLENFYFITQDRGPFRCPPILWWRVEINQEMDLKIDKDMLLAPKYEVCNLVLLTNN